MKRPERFPAGEPRKKPGILAELVMTAGLLLFCLILYTLLDRHVIGAAAALAIIVVTVALCTFLMQTHGSDRQHASTTEREECPPPPDFLAMLSRARDKAAASGRSGRASRTPTKESGPNKS